MKEIVCYGCGEVLHPTPAHSRCQICGQLIAIGRTDRSVLDKALGPRQLEQILARLVERNGLLASLLALENVCEEKDQGKDGTWAEVAGIVGTAAHNIPKWWATRR